MKKISLFFLTTIIAFSLGYAFSTYQHISSTSTSIKRVTGIGGIFFKSQDPKTLRAWYQEHLGLNVNDYGCVFEWHQGADSTQKGFTQWSPFGAKTKYFEPSTKDFMINYRVENLDQLVRHLKSENVLVLDSIATYDYGKFVHILDLEGNKIELWEPNDLAYERLGKQMGASTTK